MPGRGKGPAEQQANPQRHWIGSGQTEWEDEWNDELLDLIRVLTVTTELAPKQKDLLERITTGSLIKNSELPARARVSATCLAPSRGGFVQETLL
ncbi:hypothetical protein GS876_21970 [Rhodococcus hoagii]|nr:hypothetical protein [Prescottella equi]